MINADTRARFALFNRAPKPEDDPSKTYPVMFGSIENKDFKIQVSAFLKVNRENGKKFLSLVIRNEGDQQTFTGTLHRSDKPGKEDTYYGYISEQFVDYPNGEAEYTQSEWQVGISAKVEIAAGTQRKYIGGNVYALNRARKPDAQVPDAAPAEEELPL